MTHAIVRVLQESYGGTWWAFVSRDVESSDDIVEVCYHEAENRVKLPRACQTFRMRRTMEMTSPALMHEQFRSELTRVADELVGPKRVAELAYRDALMAFLERGEL